MGKSKRKIVRGASRGFIVIVPEDPSSCTVTYVLQADAGGHLGILEEGRRGEGRGRLEETAVAAGEGGGVRVW